MSDIVKATGELILHLRAIVGVEKVRRRQLNELVEEGSVGGVAIGVEDRETLRTMSLEVRELLTVLGWERERGGVHGLADALRDGDGGRAGARLLPLELTEAYELLWVRTYERGRGSDGGGGKKAKKTGANRAVVRDQEAFDMKRKVDRRLRRVAGDIGVFLSGGSSAVGGGGDGRCRTCGRLMDDAARFCSWCGAERRS